MTLSDYLDRYRQSHDITASTSDHYHWVVRSFERLAGPVELDQLSGDEVSRWLAWLKESGRSPFTIKQRRISLMVLWRSAWESGLAPPLQPVRRLKPLRHSPTAWTLDEVRLLFAAADRSNRPTFWGSLCRAAYDSGLRLGDLLALCVHHIAPLCTIVQRKTGSLVTVQFRPETLQAIQRQTGDRTATELVWPLWGRREAFYRAFRKLVRSASIRPGTFRWLRRTAATQVEIVAPGRATELLGHQSRATTESWYLDRSQLGAAPLPPL
jgi:integrase